MLIGESLLILFTILAIISVLAVSLIPFVPGPVMMWVVMLAFGLLDGFIRLPVPIFVVMTVVMVIGSTTDFWMPILGMRAQGASCWGAIGTLLGAVIGTFVIPIPILGTLLGAVFGALAFEFIHVGDARLAFSAGRSAAKSFVLGLAVEFVASLMIVGLFGLSLYLTG